MNRLPRFLFPGVWLIPLMIALGIALRAGFSTSLPALVAGVYLAVGAALLGSTGPYFRYWRSGGRERPPAVEAA